MKPKQTQMFNHTEQGEIPTLRFDGPDYDPKLDQPRLSRQNLKIYHLMTDEQWRTLSEIADSTDEPEASISAQLRHFRKERFGGHQINKKRRWGDTGLWEYQLITNKENEE
jgi:hypothetical protein